MLHEYRVTAGNSIDRILRFSLLACVIAALFASLIFISQGCWSDSDLAGYRLAVSVRNGTTADIYIADGNGTLIDRITDTPFRTEMWPTWSSTEEVMFFEATDNDSVMTLLVRKRLSSGAEDTIYSRPGRGGLWFSVSPDGRKIAYVIRHDHETQLIVEDSLGTKRLTVGEEHIRLIRPEWHPDSRRLLCQVRDASESQWDLALVDAETGIIERIMETPARSEFRPAWSPDGKYLVYSTAGAEQRVSSSLMISNADGSGQQSLEVEGNVRLAAGAWSSGLRLAALGERPLPLAVLIWPEPWASVKLRRTELNGKWRHGRVVWSPDGRFLAVNVTHRRPGKAGGWAILILDSGGRIVEKWPEELDASCPAWEPVTPADANV